MTNLIFGVGTGLFIILVLWVLAFLVFIISLRIEKKFGLIAILIVSIFTIILIALPRASEKVNSTDKKIYDHLFVWRVLLLVLLTTSSVIGLIGYIKLAMTNSVRSIRITNWTF